MPVDANADSNDDSNGHSNDDKPRYRGFTWEEFRRRRRAGDYQDLGEEVQISHYRI